MKTNVDPDQLDQGAQWLSGRVLDSRPRGRGFKPHRRHCVVSLSKNINSSLVLVQPRKTRPFITERLLMGRKESNKKKKKYVLLNLNLSCNENNVDPDQLDQYSFKESPLYQGSHRLEKYLNIQECLEKSLKIKFALKSTEKTQRP